MVAILPRKRALTLHSVQALAQGESAPWRSGGRPDPGY